MSIFPNAYISQAAEQGSCLARIVAHYGQLYTIKTDSGEKTAKVSGKFSHDTKAAWDYPIVGDYVLVDSHDDGDDIIQKVLARTSVFARKAAGTANKTQAICANIDYAFICMSLNKDFSLRRLERYISLTWESGATPVVILTKSDLCDDIASKVFEVETVALGVDIVVTNISEQNGIEKVKGYLKEDKTATFLGSSGVGKSTLINAILNKEVLKTADIRHDDDKGKHTTTTRHLFYLKEGGAVIDTPGMREIGIDSGDTAHTFADIELLAESCKFSDCKHESEPGCAVKAAIVNGDIDEKRLQSYQKLKIEMGYEGLDSKQLEKVKIERMFSSVGGMKNARKIMNENDKRK
jgi:ribosome biogenesis GTPase / thiamine phosphate phosphatase